MAGVGFFFQAEEGIRDLERYRGLGDVYKGQMLRRADVTWYYLYIGVSRGSTRGVMVNQYFGDAHRGNCL